MTPENFTTTLGREGSDYTASIFAYALDAEEVVVWKDVPGILNADPKIFQDTLKISNLSYYEAIEMTYYGAKVIHPKTIKPLRNKEIKLVVKSFQSPEKEGTSIRSRINDENLPPIIVLKSDQILISIATKDFSFITEDNLSDIYGIFARNKLKVNLMQIAALSCTVCVDNQNNKVSEILNDLTQNFNTLSNEDLDLLTIRHYNDEIIENLTGNRNILLEQKSRTTVQMVMKMG